MDRVATHQGAAEGLSAVERAKFDAERAKRRLLDGGSPCPASPVEKALHLAMKHPLLAAGGALAVGLILGKSKAARKVVLGAITTAATGTVTAALKK